MPIIFSGRHRCEYCQKVFNWVNFESIRSHMDSSYYVAETIPTEAMAYRVEALGNRKYRIEMNCPKCGKYNIFEYSGEEECEA